MKRFSERSLFWIALAAVAVPRLLLCFVAQDVYGDAVVRGELASRWAADPHFIGSFDQGCFQFGPLQIYLLGLLDLLGVARDQAGRWVSLAFGIATLVPLWRLTRRLFDVRAAFLAGLGLACWGMHLQFSTTGGSEALSLFLIAAVVDSFAQAIASDDRRALMISAIWLNLACATRYDAWLYVPFLAAAWVLTRGLSSWPRAVLFGLASSAFAIGWMYGNDGDLHDPLYPFRYIDDFHRRWFHDGEKVWGPIAYRVQNFFFWPGAALATLSPVIAVLGGWGLVKAWRTRRDVRWLVALVVIPTVLFTARSSVFGTFVPLGRFTCKELLLLLPFVGLGAAALESALPRFARPLETLGWTLAVAMPLALFCFTYQREGKWEESLRPISPVTTQPIDLVRAMAWVRQTLAAEKNPSLILDSDPHYWDLPIAFHSGLPEDRLARYRWDTFGIRLHHRQPRLLLRFENGGLASGPLKVEGDRVTLEDRVFTETTRFGPIHVYSSP